jgi:hypothetical protein
VSVGGALSPDVKTDLSSATRESSWSRIARAAAAPASCARSSWRFRSAASSRAACRSARSRSCVNWRTNCYCVRSRTLASRSRRSRSRCRSDHSERLRAIIASTTTTSKDSGVDKTLWARSAPQRRGTRRRRHSASAATRVFTARGPLASGLVSGSRELLQRTSLPGGRSAGPAVVSPVLG